MRYRSEGRRRRRLTIEQQAENAKETSRRERHGLPPYYHYHDYSACLITGQVSHRNAFSGFGPVN